jgi:hypothetical protein
MRDKLASELGVRNPTLWCTVCQHAFERRIYHCLTILMLSLSNAAKYPLNKDISIVQKHVVKLYTIT